MRKGLFGFAAALTTLALTPAVAGAATINVSTTADQNDTDPECSVREAVNTAVADMTGGAGTMGCDGEVIGGFGLLVTDEIVLPPLGTYLTNNAAGNIVVGAGGPIVIRSSDPAARRTISNTVSGGVNRIFDVSTGTSDLTLQTLKLVNAEALGSPGTNGGIIDASAGGDLTLQNVELDADSATFPPNAQNGGAITVQGAGGDLSISDSFIHGGDATANGGAIFAGGSSSVEIMRTRIEGNSVTSSTGGAQGGAISTSATSPVITDSVLLDNTAHGTFVPGTSQGGAIFTDGATGDLTVRRSLISGNQVYEDLAPGGNELGGGIAARNNGTAVIRNSTIIDNVAGDAVGLATGGQGGGIFASTSVGAMDLNHVTFSGNNAVDAGGGDQIFDNGGGVVTFRASIIPSGGPEACAGVPATSGGFNAMALPIDAQCPASATDVAGGTIGLAGSLANNGGTVVGGIGGAPIQTLAISSTGTAFNLVPSGVDCATSQGHDQRGTAFTRPKEGACDAGAFELCTTPSTLAGCPAVPAETPPTPPAAGPTGERLAALLKCFNKKTRKARRKCKNKALKLPV